MKNRCPSEQNTRTIRIGVGDYTLLNEISIRAGITMAESLHLALERQEVVTRVPMSQIPMPVFRVTPQAIMAVNGAGVTHSAFKIKPKGGVIHE